MISCIWLVVTARTGRSVRRFFAERVSDVLGRSGVRWYIVRFIE